MTRYHVPPALCPFLSCFLCSWSIDCLQCLCHGLHGSLDSGEACGGACGRSMWGEHVGGTCRGEGLPSFGVFTADKLPLYHQSIEKQCTIAWRQTEIGL